VLIKFFNEDRLKEILRDITGTCEYKHDNGEISQVSVKIAGMGTKRIRIAGLPPEVKEATIKESLPKYGEIGNIRGEIWAAIYRYKVFNGIKIVEIKLKRHMPSHLTIAGNNALISYDGQPPTCYRCNEPGHQQAECPRRKRLDLPTHGMQSTWDDIVSNATRDTHQIMPTRQSDNGIRNRQLSPSRIVNKSPNPDTRVQAQDMQELSSGIGRQTPDALPQSLIPEHLSMDTQETITRSVDAPDQGNECELPSIMPHNIDKQDTPVDRATGETETMMTHNNELEGETNKMEQRHLYGNVRDEDPSTEGHSLASPSTSTSRPKKLKTDCDDPALRTRNRSKTKSRTSANKQCPLPPPSPSLTYNTECNIHTGY